ncbi:MAG: hypothetical protein EA403_03185 [Spirochaetaceae bacterium]|nr:MAG: hypothetical protein EA403_03185 [Spirochaetaceae bacterium]
MNIACARGPLPLQFFVVNTFDSARKTVPAGTLEEADLHYDAGFMLWCYELNREPSLSGHYLTFKDWDEQALFLNSVGGESAAWTLLERAALQACARSWDYLYY